jgi:tetratricopeptide (TPR) repeat protein
MSDVIELSDLVSALRTAQSVGAGADRATVTAALEELEATWERCPDGSLDAFDQANIQLTRSTLQQLLDLDGGASIAEALRCARQVGPEQEDQRLLVQVLLAAGNHERQIGDFDSARGLIDEAVERAKTVLGPLDEETAQAYNCLGMWGRYRGEFDLARKAYGTALRIVERGRYPEQRANILHNLASLEHLVGKPESALQLIETALQLREPDDAERDADDAVRAVILIDLLRYPESARLFESLAVRLSRRWGADSAEMMHLNANWAVLEQHRGDDNAAQSHYERALEAAERLGETGHAAAPTIYANAAHLAYACGDFDTAGYYVERALAGLEGRATADLPSLRLARQVRDALAS